MNNEQSAQIAELNDGFCDPANRESQWAYLIALMSLVPEKDYAALFAAHQKMGWPARIVRALARMHTQPR